MLTGYIPGRDKKLIAFQTIKTDVATYPSGRIGVTSLEKGW
jgi:hypothetical protein